jgi:PEP-CTERM motif
MPALPQAVIKALGLGSSDSSTGALPDMTASTPGNAASKGDGFEATLGTDASSQLTGLNPDALSGLDGGSNVFGEFVLADRGIHLEWDGCADCDTPGPTNLVPWGGVGLSGGGGEAPPNGLNALIESGNPSPEVIAEVEGTPPPEGDSPNDPLDPDEPRPQPRDPVPVPEPSTVTLMCAAFSVMIGTSRARRRQR